MEIQIYSDGGMGMCDIYETNTHIFSGGELLVTVPGIPKCLKGDISVVSRIQSSDDFVRLMLLTSLLERRHHGSKKLVFTYFPYSRDDRIFSYDRSFGLKTVALEILSLDLLYNMQSF